MTQRNSFPFKRHVRTIWISDLHLGFPGCSAEQVLDFIREMRCETLYLVGDIVDFWYLKKKRHWPQSHSNVIRSLLGKAKHGTRVIYVPGNHDEAMRQYDGMTIGNIEVTNEIIHETADGRRLLVLHGDQFDAAVVSSPLLGLIGSRVYDGLLKFNRLINWIRTKMGRGHWSLAAYIKQRVKKAVKFMSNFEEAVRRSAQKNEVDGLVCGHIHRPEIAVGEEVIYLNCGDWVESCTALIEHHDGTIELIRSSDVQEVVKRLPPRRKRSPTPDAQQAA
ncbi:MULTISPECIES: UDP-2,3-diacylglucosamine diphosphatase [unclassified Wenzhouxiangella]|uniref:UDP-2,3-diacylglucosamine diphosphatase n=1 Tax=unclassified Wenzhouxiangella TaxID=2613841 RepID=UPI000E3295ED|nr:MULTISPECIES: UDP-2,3-diacylglucosamine diphosphatase [unclassified Wenzhouxiangella]RFF28974.1 UDP-2,3-diacylglucosamine diphosphatase [Wenzhouxiangella sp. 15181]RFP68319.1 UDP-2,3-diacylglucosamine diphosphatase [Wenzhouxiangella sp. 15190]